MKYEHKLFKITYLKVYRTLFKKHVFPRLERVAMGVFHCVLPPYWLSEGWWPFNMAMSLENGSSMICFCFVDDSVIYDVK